MTLLDFHPPQTNTTLLTDLTSQVGNTPLLPLRRITEGLSPRVQVFAKAEWFNPAGSIKDRTAVNIIREALANGKLDARTTAARLDLRQHGDCLCHVWRCHGYPRYTVPAGKRQPGKNRNPASARRGTGADPMRRRDRTGQSGWCGRLAAEKPDLYWYANQYDNPANWQAHYVTTGPEIFAQTNGEITHLVVG